MDPQPGEFWDARFRTEGAIWGDAPSPTARLAADHARAGDRVLEVGFGYGRDLAFLGQRGCRVSGVDLSAAGLELAQARLQQSGVRPECLWTGPFEDSDIPALGFDVVLCHRMAHLLLTPEAVGRFARKVEEVLRPGGLVCLGARDLRDLNPADMVAVADQVYEYLRRPGHRIRYWSDDTFRRVFGGAFTLLTLLHAVESETEAHPVPCHLTVMVARKRPASAPVASPDGSAG